MALYINERDISFFRSINRELLQRIMCQEIGYYKLVLKETKVNLYNEAPKKFYFNPLKLNCAIDHQDQASKNDEAGVDVDQLITFSFLRDDLKDIQLVPERGDIIMWRESYYEVDNIIENQLIGGKQAEYSVTSDLEKFGESWSIRCVTHLTQKVKLNITKSR